ncbi:MAG: leucine-rich repeat domain-containing protein [Clostridia bacterium]|nr:leucine-rich repeat domain-containing protein [Clostridia bacterium]
MKKLTVFLSLLMLLACSLAIMVSAEDSIIKLDTIPTLEEIHANPSDYVSHLDAFDSSAYKEQDANSVIVLSDLQATPTYYVFPAYYLVQATSARISTASLNTALQASAHATKIGAYSSYATTGNYGANNHFIRVEMPTYVTTLTDSHKFEECYNLLEVYFPTKTVTDAETGEEKTVSCITSITGTNTFNNCTKLEVIHNVKYFPTMVGSMFTNCKKLTSVELPENLSAIPNYLFNGCSALGSVNIPDAVTSVGTRAFLSCSSIKELILPNTVVSVGKEVFAGMSSLEKLSFGASCTTITGTDGNCEIIPYSLSKLKYVYMPAKFVSQVGDASKAYRGIFSLSSKHIIFFTGTQAEFQTIIDFAKSHSSNTTIQNATFDEYNPETAYNEDYYNSRSGITVVYNYNLCEAFYEGQHEASGKVKKTFAGEDFLSEFTATTGCVRECGKETVLDTLAPLFVDRGFSYGPDSMLQGVAVDKALLTEYAKYFNEIKYGLVAAAKSAQDSASILNTDGTSVNGYVAAVDFTDRPYDLFDMNLYGITENHKTTEFYFGAYVIANGVVYYIHNGTTNNEAQAITYNDVVVIVDALVPTNKDE